MVLLRPPLSLVAAAALAAPALSAQQGSLAFYRAYYLEHEEGEAQGALELYRQAAEDGRLDPALRDEARRAAGALAEDLAASDFARLVPADAILYAELGRPGEQLRSLLDQLGLLQEGGAVDAGTFGVSPALLRGLLGLRGAALAVTRIDPGGGEPEGVVILHPGDLDLVRGLIETAVPTGGAPAEAIGGHPVWSLEGEALVCLTSRLVVASRQRSSIEAVVRRLDGETSGSLADVPSVREALAARGEGLVSFCLNAKPIAPMLRAMLEQKAQHDPQAGLALSLLDVDSLRYVSGRLGVDDDGVGLQLALAMEEGHRSLAFNLLRMPTLDRGTLELVPSGAAFFLAAALNPPAPVTATREARPIVTLMDFGREVFGNVVDVALFGLPPSGGARSPIPDVAAVVRVNDPQRSRALWSFVFGLASQGSGGAVEPEPVQLDGVSAERFVVNGVPLYLVTREHEVVIAPSPTALHAALGARAGGSVLEDEVLAGSVRPLAGSRTVLVAAAAGRCLEIARTYARGGEAQQMAAVAPMLARTVVAAGVEHGPTRLAVDVGVRGLPNVRPLVEQALRRQRSQSALRVPEAPRPEVVRADPTRLRSRFDRLAGADADAARACAQELVEAVGDDATSLNNFAWALLTETRYAGAWDGLAREVALRANELTSWGDWRYLDTLALACFRSGDVERALELQQRAVELAGQDPRRGEAETALERYRAAASATARGS